MSMKNNLFYIIIIFLIPITIWSAYRPKEYLLWIAEASPIWIVLLIFFIYHPRYKLTKISYLFIFIGSVMMLVGAHYSYAAVPLGEWLQDLLHLSRNPYDKIGHFFQGLIAALFMKEIISIKKLLTSRWWINFFSVSFAIALSAVWEMLEWLVAIFMIYFGSKKPALDFLGAQGYIWDTQSDMFMATLGALSVVSILQKYHERCMKREHH